MTHHDLMMVTLYIYVHFQNDVVVVYNNKLTMPASKRVYHIQCISQSNARGMDTSTVRRKATKRQGGGTAGAATNHHHGDVCVWRDERVCECSSRTNQTDT
jgi:hypothetical protein